MRATKIQNAELWHWNIGRQAKHNQALNPKHLNPKPRVLPRQLLITTVIQQSPEYVLNMIFSTMLPIESSVGSQLAQRSLQILLAGESLAAILQE